MHNFKVSTFVGFICLVQLLVILGFGLYRESGNVRQVANYVVVFYLSAVLLNFVFGFFLILINLKNRQDRLAFLLLLLTGVFLVGNEFLQTAGYVLYRFVIVASCLLCGIYFYQALKKNKTAGL